MPGTISAVSRWFDGSRPPISTTELGSDFGVQAVCQYRAVLIILYCNCLIRDLRHCWYEIKSAPHVMKVSPAAVARNPGDTRCEIISLISTATNNQPPTRQYWETMAIPWKWDIWHRASSSGRWREQLHAWEICFAYPPASHNNLACILKKKIINSEQIYPEPENIFEFSSWALC